jgi:serine/threonine protein kinase
MTDPISRLNTALEGRYRIERQLGEGGMATVYLAEDLKHERKVALKILKPELAATWCPARTRALTERRPHQRRADAAPSGRPRPSRRGTMEPGRLRSAIRWSLSPRSP